MKPYTINGQTITPFDPFAYYAEWKEHPERFISMKELVKEAEENIRKRKWTYLVASAPNLESFNGSILPLMKSSGPEFLEIAKTEAVRRGYKANKATGLYEAGKIA